MKTVKQALLATTVALAALPAIASVGDAGTIGGRHVHADGAHQRVDPFTEHLRGGTRDVFTDGARTGQRDVRTDGA
ncbi:hypothetical protein EM868_18065 [Cupriavidus gilardii]|nr:hypothetical protein [Cupriavidus gilardii]NSX03342.1 hypothetical protein [Cupriavidus gilardii]